ncbi:AraC family transcriptional regulator [Enterovibrio sp. ZSDZ35]|uniref:AraC family transcriptional regulator n=1 Tax=Enterovibrio qingdaonensis TaxID=2899818 RepID=A0ABT5QIZ8_9GAMM|nr:AraC family transcriptional regulator [Enterovibrio sp. ZSDZ35]MDD1780955.1 AraC family transcriptional regulator [Enterovibrio sp. ZSDZ35]
MRQSTAEHYRKRIDVLFDYIYEHINDDLDMATLADVALISPYHLHRVYRGIYGSSLSDTIKRIRLHNASDTLINSDLSIEDVAKQAKYTSVQSFTRAFSESFGMPPARFRREGDHIQFSLNPLNTEESIMHDVTIKHADGMTLIGYEHKGDYMNVGQQFEKLQGWLVSKGLLTETTRFFGVYFDDPESVPIDKLTSLACVRVDNVADFPLEEDMHKYTVHPTKCAVLNYKGPYANMDAAYKWLFANWLPSSGEKVGYQPVFEEYLNDAHHVPQTELLTDIYIPLES